MTTPLSVALAEMHRQFADQLGNRVAAVRDQFAQLDPADWQPQRVAALHRLVHGLTGAAGTFGMNSVSDAARVLEQQLVRVLAAPPSAAGQGWSDVAAALDRLEKLAQVRLLSNAPSLALSPLHTVLPGSPPLIHLVEDDPEQARALGQALKAHGYPVHTFACIADFHAACARGELPAAIVMDMIFGNDTEAGAKAITELKAGLKDLPPVVFVSVRDDIDARLAAYRAGASRYFSKPVDSTRLNRVLDELTGRMPPEAWRVLLVDDDPLLLEAQAAVLRQAGMEVKALSQPLDTLDVVRGFNPDVLVLDVYMPEANGPELAAILREQDAHAHLPILFLSAESDMSKQLLALNLGGDDFLVKPVQPAHLVAAVAARARRARQNGEMMAHLKTMLYEREREHMALNQHAIVSIANVAGNITYVNDKFCSVSGYAAAELLNHNHRILKSGLHPPEFYAAMWRTIAGGNIWNGEICNRKKTGEIYWVESTITPFLDANGKPYQYVAIRTEITALKMHAKEMEEAHKTAENANRTKSEFLANMSHELRTPMNAILGFAQLLDFDVSVAPEHKDHAGEILKAGRHLLELINEILDLSRIESGRIDLSIEPTELAPLIEECIGLMRPLAAKRTIIMRQNSGAGHAVHADRTRLRQVLLNLLSNAIKYNRNGGSIDIAVGAGAAGSLRVAVTDSGPGIAPARLGELFQPFNRLDAASSNIEGTGIGLVITRRLIEAMGGNVGVDSTPGVGSTFWIELPQGAPPHDSATATANLKVGVTEGNPCGTGDSPPDAGVRQILYIEDNPANLRLVAQILGRNSHVRLVTAHAPRLGIELALTQPPDLILLDINMPEINGFQVLEILQADARTKAVPVIAISANALPRDIEQGLAAGFRDYLTKPLDIERFLASVERCLAH